MSNYSPNRRPSVNSNCTNDSDVASDKTPISGQPKKLRKQINNDEFKQNYFELSLNNTGVQVLAFQPGNDTTPKKRKRSSTSASRRKSVSSVAEDSTEESSPKVQTKQIKKRKQSVVSSVDTPEDLLFSDDATIQAIDQSLLQSISCDQEIFESLLQTNERRKESSMDSVFLPKSAFKDSKIKGRNLACSTNIQTTSTCSYSLKNSPETPNSATSARNRSISNSHPHILNQTNTNVIRKRSNSCVSVGQLSSSSVSTTTPVYSINNNNNNNSCTLPPERLMAKPMKLNTYLSMKKVENCGNSQTSPMTCSTASTPQDNVMIGGMSSVSTAPTFASQFHQSGFDSNTAFQLPTNNISFFDNAFQQRGWEGMQLASNHQQQQQDVAQTDFSFLVNASLVNEATCKQVVDSFFQDGLDPSLFETLYTNIQDSFDTAVTQQQPQPSVTQNYSNGPELSLERLHSMDHHQIKNLIDYLERLQDTKRDADPAPSTQQPPQYRFSIDEALAQLHLASSESSLNMMMPNSDDEWI